MPLPPDVRCIMILTMILKDIDIRLILSYAKTREGYNSFPDLRYKKEKGA